MCETFSELKIASVFDDAGKLHAKICSRWLWNSSSHFCRSTDSQGTNQLHRRSWRAEASQFLMPLSVFVWMRHSGCSCLVLLLKHKHTQTHTQTQGETKCFPEKTKSLKNLNPACNHMTMLTQTLNNLSFFFYSDAFCCQDFQIFLSPIFTSL